MKVKVLSNCAAQRATSCYSLHYDMVYYFHITSFCGYIAAGTYSDCFVTVILATHT